MENLASGKALGRGRAVLTRPERGTYLARLRGGDSVVVSQLDAQTYRARAAQCLAFAERAQRDDDKATWLELAGKWQRLAEESASRGRAGATTAATGRIETVPLVSTL